MRHIFLASSLIEVIKCYPGKLCMLGKIIIPARVNAFELLETERKIIFEIISLLGIKNQILMLVPTEIFCLHSEIEIKLEAVFFQFFIRFHFLRRVGEILHFHLFEFARAENKLPRRDLIAENLADLSDAERNPDPARVENILVIDIDPLARFSS